jgi:hypothetical protein
MDVKDETYNRIVNYYENLKVITSYNLLEGTETPIL